MTCQHDIMCLSTNNKTVHINLLYCVEREREQHTLRTILIHNVTVTGTTRYYDMAYGGWSVTQPSINI